MIISLLNEFGLIGSDSESSILSMFVFSMIKNFLVSVKKADSFLSDQSSSRKELVYMKKTGQLKILFSFLAQSVRTVGIDIMTGVLSAQTHSVLKECYGGKSDCQLFIF